MILAYPVATPEIKEKYLGLHGNFEQNIQALKRIGFNAIELFTCNPNSIDAADIQAILAKYAMSVAAVGTSHLTSQEGLSLMNSSQEKSATAINRIHSIIQFASEFKAPVSIGKFRGNVLEPQNPKELKQFAETLKEICAFAGAHGIDILIEPQNKTNINNINSVADACILTDEVNLPNLRLHLDTFHLALTEDDPTDSIRFAREKICFIHLSDSERKIPGEGGIDLPAILKTLSALSYDGYLSFEIKQGDNPLETAQKAFSETTKILKRLER